MLNLMLYQFMIRIILADPLPHKEVKGKDVVGGGRVGQVVLV